VTGTLGLVMATATREPQPAAAPPRPSVPAPLATATGAFWGALSRLRGGRRSLHPIGIGFEARLVVGDVGPEVGVPLFDSPGSHRALVRFSRGAGLPEPLPDILGIALRVLDAHGPGAHQDFLLATSSGAPVVHHALLPARSFFGRTFSSILTYSMGGSPYVVGARSRSDAPHDGDAGLGGVAMAAARGALAYDVAIARPLGRFAPVARVEVGERLPDDESERLRFNVWNSGGGIRPSGPFQGVRMPAYEGSQSGRRT
jgi:hypothetical protein